MDELRFRFFLFCFDLSIGPEWMRTGADQTYVSSNQLVIVIVIVIVIAIVIVIVIVTILISSRRKP